MRLLLLDQPMQRSHGKIGPRAAGRRCGRR